MLENAWISKVDPFADNWLEGGSWWYRYIYHTLYLSACIQFVYVHLLLWRLHPRTRKLEWLWPSPHRGRGWEPLGKDGARLKSTLCHWPATWPYLTYFALQTPMSIYRWPPTYVVPHKIFYFTMARKQYAISGHCTQNFEFWSFLGLDICSMKLSRDAGRWQGAPSPQSAMQSWEKITHTLITILHSDSHSVFHFQYSSQ